MFFSFSLLYLNTIKRNVSWEERNAQMKECRREQVYEKFICFSCNALEKQVNIELFIFHSLIGTRSPFRVVMPCYRVITLGCIVKPKLIGSSRMRPRIFSGEYSMRKWQLDYCTVVLHVTVFLKPMYSMR